MSNQVPVGPHKSPRSHSTLNPEVREFQSELTNHSNYFAVPERNTENSFQDNKDDRSGFSPRPEENQNSKFPQFFITTMKARVRSGQALDSSVVDDIDGDSTVRVEEIAGRRARISQPFAGWLSIQVGQGSNTKTVLTKADARKQQIGEQVLVREQESSYWILGKILDFDAINDKIGLYHITCNGKEFWFSPESGHLEFLGPTGTSAIRHLPQNILADLHPQLKEQYVPRGAGKPFREDMYRGRGPPAEYPSRYNKGDPTLNSREPMRGEQMRHEHRGGDPREFNGYGRPPPAKPESDQQLMMEKYLRRRLAGENRQGNYPEQEFPGGPRDPRAMHERDMRHPRDPREYEMHRREREMRGGGFDPRMDQRYREHMDPRMAAAQVRDHGRHPRDREEMRDPRDMDHGGRMAAEHRRRMEMGMREPRSGPGGRPEHPEEFGRGDMSHLSRQEQENQRRVYEYYLSKKNYERHRIQQERGHPNTKIDRESARGGRRPEVPHWRIPRLPRLPNNGEKILIIIRGFPGSGKTLLARSIAERFQCRHLVCSEDRYHWTGGDVGMGNFVFRPEISWRTRDWCAREVVESLQEGVPLVIVDNINYRIIHYEEHIRTANRLGYTAKILEIIHDGQLLSEFRTRCKLNLAEDEWIRLGEKWETDPRVQLITPPYLNSQPEQLQHVKNLVKGYNQNSFPNQPHQRQSVKETSMEQKPGFNPHGQQSRRHAPRPHAELEGSGDPRGKHAHLMHQEMSKHENSPPYRPRQHGGGIVGGDPKNERENEYGQVSEQGSYKNAPNEYLDSLQPRNDTEEEKGLGNDMAKEQQWRTGPHSRRTNENPFNDNHWGGASNGLRYDSQRPV